MYREAVPGELVDAAIPPPPLPPLQMWIGEERQPGSDWPAELELDFDWSRGPDVTIIRLSGTSILFYFMPLFFRRFVICLEKKHV